MLWSMKDIKKYKILAEDGEIGNVHEFLFDDELWIIRYLVVDIGGWLSDRKILIAPVALGHPDQESQKLPVKLSKAQIKDSPDINTNQPISRQHENSLREHYNWPYLDELGGGLFEEEHIGMDSDSLIEMLRAREKTLQNGGQTQAPDPHLQSSREVSGYHIIAQDGDIGHIEDFVVNTDTWAIRYLVIDTGNWLPGRKVVISPFWIEEIKWAGSEAQVNLSKETIKNSPEYDPEKLVQQEYEQKLFNYYGWPKRRT